MPLSLHASQRSVSGVPFQGAFNLTPIALIDLPGTIWSEQGTAFLRIPKAVTTSILT